MKHRQLIFLFLGVAAWFTLFTFACKGGKSHPRHIPDHDTVQVSDTLPHIVFLQTAQDLGKIMEGEKIEVIFEYYNSGAEDLQITGVETSCGCTTVSWDKTALPHGESGSLKVLFNSEGFSGLQTKAVRVLSNSRKKESLLAITADIIEQSETN
jgi:hypothetical protein